ncbi:MAG: beta-mannosidase, partial [Bacteroidales bacterium]|nr:beta-mannosidase [Bacteroidales bacterium]
MTKILKLAAILFACILTVSCKSNSAYPYVDDGKFIVDGKVSYYVGSNAWYAGRLSQTDEGKARLEKELDLLCSLGIKNIRITATEGEDLDALALTLEQMRKRGMHAVLFMNNAWEWSYGFADYLEAAGAGAQPKPSVDGYWPYMQAMAAFSTNKEAQKLSQDYIAKVVNRFKGNEAIFSWQICNEPRFFIN